MPTNNVVCFDCFLLLPFFVKWKLRKQISEFRTNEVMISFHIIMCQPHVTQLRSELLDHSHSPRACEFARETKEVPELL